MAAPPVLLVHLYTNKVLERILEGLAAADLPDKTRVYVGTYGINEAEARMIIRRGFLYAPAFQLFPDQNKEVRAKRPFRKALPQSPGDPFAGPFPAPAKQRLPTRQLHEWGLELGRRFRDQLEIKRASFKAKHLEIETWQLDEIYGECRNDQNAATGLSFRTFTRGVVQGLGEGRRPVDKIDKGIVWIPRSALHSLSRSLTAELRLFWDGIDAGTSILVGEEYPPFVGNATDSGHSSGADHRALAERGKVHPACKRLAANYIVGMTPGWKLRPGLGGNPRAHPKSLSEVTAWRNEFATSRARGTPKPCGYAQFSFDHENVDPPEGNKRIDSAIETLRVAAGAHVHP